MSINDQAKHLGGLDVMAITHSFNGHGALARKDRIADESLDNLILVDSWDEFLDLPGTSVVVRACGNWQARLAMATSSVQQLKRTLVLPKRPCLDCLRASQGSGKYEVIVA